MLHKREKKKEKEKREPLRERRQPRKRAVHGEENKKERAKYCHLLRKIISACESKENKRDFFINRETYIRIIVIDLIIVKLFEVCTVVFPLKKKEFST